MNGDIFGDLFGDYFNQRVVTQNVDYEVSTNRTKRQVLVQLGATTLIMTPAQIDQFTRLLQEAKDSLPKEVP